MLDVSSRWHAVRESLRAQLWPIPTAAVLLAVLVGVGLPKLDENWDPALPAWTGSYLFSGDPDAARTVLDAVASSLITVTSLTFSLTVVTLQLASSQFSPRLLRTFTRDLFVQTTLAVFLATFVYALTVLRTVRTASDTQIQLVPRLAVTMGFLLAVASVLGLVLFLAHLARQIRVETMLRNVHTDATQTAKDLLGRTDQASPRTVPPEIPSRVVMVLARSSGFLVQVDEHQLIDAATKAGAHILIDPCPGDFLVAGTPVAFVWADGSELSDRDRQMLEQCICASVTLGFERTAGQDVAFGLRQLTDVATKALSPGINDPTTAVHALGHAAALLCTLAERELGPIVRLDESGTIRVILRRPELADLLDLAIAQPRRYGAADPAVLARLYRLLREIAWCSAASQRGVLTAQLARLNTTAADQGFDTTERARLGELSDQVEAAVRHAWPIETLTPRTESDPEEASALRAQT